ncbi:MAG: hypothetical protein M3M97_06715 [Actinomycetota bacterium]|nr:hypothetical protein [Actinomycetota bacterium]
MQPEAPDGCSVYEIRDSLSRKIGCVEELFADGEGEVRRGEVRLFGFRRSVLIPVRAIEVDEGRRTVVLR